MKCQLVVDHASLKIFEDLADREGFDLAGSSHVAYSLQSSSL